MSYEEYTVRVYSDGTKYWYQNGKLHRTDGPAVEHASGTKKWFQNDKLHRTDGPAVECSDGAKFWFQNGERHRTDGPAVERADGSKEWWIDGKELSEQEFLARQNSCKGKVVEIDGKKYKLVEV